MKDEDRFERLCKLLDEKHKEQMKASDTYIGKQLEAYERSLLDSMEKAIRDDDLLTAYKYRMMLVLME